MIDTIVYLNFLLFTSSLRLNTNLKTKSNAITIYLNKYSKQGSKSTD